MLKQKKNPTLIPKAKPHETNIKMALGDLPHVLTDIKKLIKTSLRSIMNSSRVHFG